MDVKTILYSFFKCRKGGGEKMLVPNHKKIVAKLKKNEAIMANQCTCSNCNCRAVNKMVKLINLYKTKLTFTRKLLLI